jgi:hypothetical protein
VLLAPPPAPPTITVNVVEVLLSGTVKEPLDVPPAPPLAPLRPPPPPAPLTVKLTDVACAGTVSV